MKKINLISKSLEELLNYAQNLYQHLNNQGKKVFFDLEKIYNEQKIEVPDSKIINFPIKETITNSTISFFDKNLLSYDKSNKKFKTALNSIIADNFDYKISLSQTPFKSNNIEILTSSEKNKNIPPFFSDQIENIFSALIHNGGKNNSNLPQVQLNEYDKIIKIVDDNFSNTIFQKKRLRKKIKKLKNSRSAHDRKLKSNYIMSLIESSSEFKNAEYVFIYWAMDDEVDTRDFIIKWNKDKKFILPTVNGDDLILKLFENTDNLNAGESYGILEPVGGEFTEMEKIDLAIIPGVAFDNNNNRLGRGKGYYDKTLKKLQKTAALTGICFDFQLVSKVPTEAHDIQLDNIIYG